MKKSLMVFLALLPTLSGFAQVISADSLYLGQTPPGNTPKVFKLVVTPGHFATERISISNDNKEIYYSEIKAYYPIRGQRIKSYCFTNGKWNGPFDLFEGFLSPSLSVNGNIMYFENEVPQMFYSIKSSSNWGNPKRMLVKIDTAHYLQVTNTRNYYVSAKTKSNIGLKDWCKLEINGTDTSAVSLGMPPNTIYPNLDFFVAKDESYMIVASPRGLAVSYPKTDGGWTNPRSLGPKINFGLGMWGPYVTSDNKYLFYTTGTKPDYSDVNVYWVRVDGLIDSLKRTNIPPYLKHPLKVQNALVGSTFSFTVPDDTFFDEDSNTPFTYSATLLDGSPLPKWISFDPSARIFSGTPAEIGSLNIRFTATDNANGTAACLLTIDTKPLTR